MSTNKHVFPKYSITGGELSRAGEILRSNHNELTEEWEDAFELLSRWRAMHAYPLNTFQAGIRSILNKNKKEAIVAQRLKRLQSILLKLSRFREMRLGRMQDIGGIRIILSSVRDVYAVVNALKKARWKHELHNEKDYISSPQKSGYRSFHLIYKYRNQQAPEEYQGLHIEIQIRTRLQHIWATTVETIGTFIKHSLKSSQGPQEWLDYLRLVSAVFAIEEETEVPMNFSGRKARDLVRQLQNETRRLKVFSRLDAFHKAVKSSTDKHFKNKFILLRLDVENSAAEVRIFNQKDLPLATKRYGEFEKKEKDINDMVLVASSSLKELKQAYPNYFVDSREFFRQLNRIFRKYGLDEISSDYSR